MFQLFRNTFNRYLAPFIYSPQSHSVSSFANRGWSLVVVFFVILFALFQLFLAWFYSIEFFFVVVMFFIVWHFLYMFNIFNIWALGVAISILLLILVPSILIFELIFVGFACIWFII